jgi:hypothetical protein
MSKSGFFIDSSDFDKKFKDVTKNIIPSLAGKGLFDAANELLRDAVVFPPQVPFLKGDLRGSKIVEKAKKDRNDISVKTGFNIEYATRQHEAEPGEFNYTRIVAKQPGPKFLESKMVKFKDKYMAIAAAVIKAGSR